MNSMVVSAQDARMNLMQKRGSPRAVLLSMRDYVSLSTPEPEVLRIIGEESRRKGTDKLSARQIDQVIKSAHRNRSKRR